MASKNVKPIVTIKKQTTFRKNDMSLDYYLKDINKYKLLTPEKEIELFVKFKNGDELAGDQIIQSNARFVVSVAKQYQTVGVPLPDLISVGNSGLIKALRRFDDTMGYKFISFAVWWIRQAILTEIANNGRTIRIPINVLTENTRNYKKTGEHIPSVSDVNVVSLDSKFSDTEFTMLDTIKSNMFPSPDNVNVGTTHVQRAMQILTDREKLILKMRFGIGYTDTYTYKEISREMDDELSGERIRQILERTMRKLRYRLRKVDPAILFD